MTVRLVEPVVDAVRAQLQAHLPAELRLLETDIGLAVNSLLDPVAYLYGSRTNYTDFPTIVVNPDPATVAWDFLGGQKRKYELMVICVFTSSDEELLHRLSARYEAGITRTLIRRRSVSPYPFLSPDGVAIGIEMTDKRIDYSDVYGNDTGLFLRAVGVGLTAVLQEVLT